MLRVIAAPGLNVPREENPRAHITTTPTQVPDTTYYRRRLATGELLPIDDEPTADVAPTKRK